MSSLKEVVLGMVARKQLSAAQAMALVESLRDAKLGAAAPAGPARLPIAIVGMSGRFPGARNVSEFWSNLAAGQSAIAEVPASRWDAARYYDPDPLAPGKTCCKWGGFLSGVDDFDAAFFNISPKEAQLMDPQQRLFLEESWRALEDAGYGQQALDGLSCGVFVGAGAGDYIHQLAAEGIAADGYSFMGNANSILAARISYQLNLKGPSLAVDTACSSALTAIHLAAESLASGACRMALAGGICLLNTPSFFLAGSKAGMLSRTGQCRTFDRDADGLVPGEAVAVVALKTLDRALADGDHIYGVIEASAINQDGRTNGITAPSAPSQTTLEIEAYRRAGISAASIGYVEAHGTGTRLGDPIEIEALTAAFRKQTPRTGFCAIGSSKTNVGHTMSAAGAVGLIKVLLSFEHRQLPPSLNFERENEAIGFSSTPFFVPTALEPFPAPESGPRRAALSSFGFSGTNVHLVIAEAPAVRDDVASPERRLLVLSARSPQALERRRADLAQWLEAHPDAPLDSVAYTLLEGRTHFEHRAAFVADDASDLLRQLRGGASPSPAADFLEEAAQRYLRGEAVAWEKLHQGPHPHRISLPTYPFEPQGYRLGESSKVRRFDGLHPLLDEEIPSGFAATFDRDLPFLRDHVVAGKCILPGACMLEMALEAARRRNGGTRTLRMENAVFHSPLVVENEPRRVELHLEEHGFRLTAGEQLICAGRLVAREAEMAPQLDLDDLRRRCGTEIDMQAVTGAFRGAGVACGPFASGLTRLWLGDGEAFGELRLPPGEIRSLGYYNLHPTLVDGAFQAAMALVSLRDPSPPQSVLVPSSVSAVTCDGPPFDRGYAFVKRKPEPDRYSFDIVLLNDEGRVVVRLGDFQARELHAQPKKRAADEQPVSFYRPVWEPVTAPAALPGGTDTERATLILRFPKDGGLGDALARRLEDRAVLQVVLDESSAPAGPGIFRVDCRQQAEVDRLIASLKPLREVYFVGASPSGGDPVVLLRVLRSLSAVGARTKGQGPIGLKAVTANAHAVLPGETPEPSQAEFAAIAQTFSREQPAFAVSVVDFPAEVLAPGFEWQSADGAGWVEWLLAESGERPGLVLAYRAERRYTRMLELGPLAPSSRAPRLRHGGVYVIVGGAGGLGWVFARHLAARYRARVLLLGRSELPASGRQRLEEMRALGGEAIYERADATDRERLRHALDLAREKWGPLNGAIHAAMVLRDVPIEAMSEEAFGAVLAPKVQGSVVLAELLRDDPLDFLAFFSSANSFFGNAGQANYAAASAFQDAFALSLDKQGRWPVKVINWGFWGEVGAVASPQHRRNAARHGVGSIRAAEGVEAFERVLHSEYVQVMPMKISIESLARLEVPARDPIGAIAEAFDAVERHGRALFLRYLQGREVFLQPGERHTSDGLYAALEIVPRYARLWGALVDILVRHGLATQADGCLHTTELVTPAAAAPAAREPWAEPFFKLLDACVGRYDEVLRGKVPATSVLFPGGSMALVAPLYGNNAIVDHYNRLVADAVHACVSQPRDPSASVRVLEVGAGTGGTSIGVLDALRECPGIVEFHYTDLSPAFVQQAKTRLARTYPFARFGLLNIEREPASQGFAAESFDIVVASNVLHATTRIADTLRHVRSLLKPGGTLIVNEATRLRDFTTLTFGLTDGWWLPADPECRIPHSPLLNEDGWRQALAEAGFHSVAACGNEAPGSAQTVFVAGAAAEMEEIQPACAAPPDARRRESLLAGITARVLNLSVSDIDVNRRFSEYGVDSIVGAELVARFSQTLGVNLRATILFDYPSVRQLAAHLIADSETAPAFARIVSQSRAATSRIDELFAPRTPASAIQPAPAADSTAKPTAIAIVGMSGRFPGASDVESFWRNLRDGKCSIREVPPDRWDVREYYDPVPGTPGKSPCKWGGFLDDIDCFDPMFFQMSGAEAEFTDPQQRLFMQEAWKALEDAGYSDRWLDQRKCGVFVGVGAGDYVHNMAARGLGPEPYAFLGNGVSILASRISYLLNLRGPAVALDTACSSSLMAVHLACQSLLSGECDLALAGGVFLSTTSSFHYLTGTLGMLSPTGQCRAFDDGADGFVPGEAVGAIVLRPLDAALRDGDRIYATILASGANQDGHTNGITAPSSVSQAELELEVYRKAAVNPETITLVEAHGTGTRLGDPLELEGLRQAFRRHTDNTCFCALGSVKTNIGHAGPAAGIASIVKVLLALRQGQVPPSLCFDRPNRHIDFDGSPFFVNRELREWTRPQGAPRRAAISSFGLSGTNVHLVLEEAPALDRQVDRPSPRLLPLSARTPGALRARVAALDEWLSHNGSSHTLTDIAYTLSAGRSHLECRTAIIARDVADLAAKLRDWTAAGYSLTGPEGLVAAAQRYLAGEDVDWSDLFAGDRPRRISLPTYPFARERYWLPSAPKAARPADQTVHYFRREWRACEHPGQAAAPQRIVIVSNRGAAAEELRRLLPGSEVFWIADGAERAIATLRASAAASYGVVLVAPALDDCVVAASALVREFPSEPVRVLVCYAAAAGIQERLVESASAFARPLALLRGGISWSAVETASMADAAAELAIPANRAHPQVRYAGGRREEKHSAPVALTAASSPPIRRGGAYWIAGGSGALGRKIARYLVDNYQAQVVLTSRNPGAAEAGVESIAADVADLAQMQAAADRIRRSFGQIHGVIHAAGKIDAALLHQKPLAAVHEVFAPKISGSLVLDSVTASDRLDFFALFSSLSALAGDFGQCDYAVANRFLETFSECRNRQVERGERHGHTVAVHWPLWAEGGMHFPGDVDSRYLDLAGMQALETEAGCRALEVCLASGLDAVAVAAGDPARILQLLGESPPPAAASLAAAPRLNAPIAAVMSTVRETTARVVKLSPERLATDACFTNFGLDSVNMKALADALSQAYGLTLSPTLFFQHQTIAAFAKHLCQEYPDAMSARHPELAPAELAPAAVPAAAPAADPVCEPSRRDGAIAIVGAAGRFPQSHDLEEFWTHLDNGDDLITEIPPERWDWKAWHASSDRDYDKSVSHWGGFMPDLDKFDAAFFGISPREAAYMDPQHRIFLETVWAALEDAGYRPSSLAGRTVGVFAGCQFNEYMGLIGDAGPARAQAALGNTHTMLANRVSFWFDFHGPSEAIDTACSSALIAVHRAVESLRNGDCELAVAGGVSAILSPETLVLSTQLGMLSPDGRCKTFDRSANGYVKGEGVGAVLLKPLDRALVDGDHIHAVIRGTAENHGGRANFLTAPNPEAQAQLLVDAYRRAGVDVHSVSYVEAHGTGTELGDPIEVDALNRAFALLGAGSPAMPFCGIGSVKSNIGHLEPAAGIAGLLKVVLAMRHSRLPRTLHVHEVNPYLKLAGSPFYLVTEPRDWEGAPLRAGVSSFGFGGSNAHVVLESAPAPPRPQEEETNSPQIVPVSAKTAEALRASVERLCASLRNHAVSWPDLVFTLQTGREPMEERLAVEAANPSDLLAKLERWLADPSTAAVHRGSCAKADNALALFDTPEELDDFVRREIAAGKWSKLARLWSQGVDVNWSLLPRHAARRISLPTYPFARTRHWFDRTGTPTPVAAPEPPAVVPSAQPSGDPAASIKSVLVALLADSLYLEPSQIEENASFTDLGLDSILAVELAKKLQDRFHVDLRATRLYDYSTVADLAAYLSTMIADPPPSAVAIAPPPSLPAPSSHPRVRAVVASVLSVAESDLDDSLDLLDLGLDTVVAQDLSARIQQEFGVSIPGPRLLSFASLKALSNAIGESGAPLRDAAPSAAENATKGTSRVTPSEDIAIIGMSGRFPGARNLDEFWANLAAGVDSVADVPADRWPIENFFDPTPGVPGKTYCRRGGFLRDIDQFDPLFFRISPQEAEWMDPQQRIFLEESWLALEDAGYPDTRLSSLNCAVYVGVSQGDYFHRVDPATAAASQFSLGNVNSILAARIAYFLNLKGPAVAVDTACSSSLVALHLACQALRSGECELAIAGGVSVMTTPHMYQLGSQGRMLSADGRCKTFDAAADGFVPAEGAGAVVLKPLSAALRDGDRVHAVVRGSGINQDGKTNGITAPSAQSQKELELAVYERFQLDPSTFSYVEAHGTGTKLGDPIEMDALTEAFAQYIGRRRFCAIGSVKTNIGHSLPAAGMAGLLKTVLAMKHGQIPPSLHCTRENEHIDFAASPFYVCRELQAWPMGPGNPRRAAVSSFGFSGTNAHIVIEEAPPLPLRLEPDALKPRAFCLSAKTPESLRGMAANLEAWLIADGGASSLDDLCYTLNVRRSAYRQRAAFVASSRDELVAGLRRFLETGQSPAVETPGCPVASAAQSWAQGASVDWSALCTSPEVRPLALPGYPFDRRRCWAEPPVGQAILPADAISIASQPAGEPACSQDWLPHKTNCPTQVRTRQLADTDELLRDHLVQGKAVLPAVAYLEMARSAAEGAELRHIVWKSPFQMNGAPRELTLQLQPADGHARFEFTSSGVTHAQGEAYSVDPSPPIEHPEWDTLLAACPAEFSAEEIYAAFAGMGISYGPSFRCLEWIRVGERDAVGKIVPRASSANYAIHPGVLDAALQTLIGFAIGLRKPVETMLPFGLDRFRVYAAVEGICYAHASVVEGDARFDVRIVNSSGRLLAAMEGFAARPLKKPAEAGELMEFQPVWRPAAAPATPAGHHEAIVFRGPEDFGLAAALARVHAGAAVLSVQEGREAASLRSEVDFERALAAVPRLSRIYFLGLSTRPLLEPDEIDQFQETGVRALFRLAKALARLETPAARPQLVVVTNNVHRVHEEDRVFPQAASLGGFARSFADEYPHIPVSIVDLDAHDLNGGQEALARALAAETADPKCPDTAWRRGRRLQRTLEPVEAALSGSERPVLRNRGVYVILGGMGGLGMTFARHLSAAHHARLVLVGRNALTGEKQQNLRDLDALGGEAMYCAADITDLDQMAQVRAEALGKWGAVNGVIHSAFLLRDQSLLRMDETRFREAFAPKARGTAVALRTFREDPLDWFALFSSSISFTGGPGQSNYAAGSTLQDALGLCWNAAGKWPVRVLNWGFWGGAGAVASDSYRASAAALGVGSINEREGIAAFTRSLSESLPQRVVLKFARKGAIDPAAPSKVSAPPAAPSSSMTMLVRAVISEVLKIPAADLEDHQPFEDYGIDSLVATSIVSALEIHVGKLPETLLFEHNTIAKLAEFLGQSSPHTPAGRSPAALFPIRETGSNQKSFWVHSVVGEMNWAVSLAHHLGPEWPFFGFQAASADSGREPFASLEEMAAAYCAELLAVQPRGPYILGGFSFGGSVAFEMARQLEQRGETVSWLVLLDAYAPGSQALQSLGRLAWDGFLPQLIANLLIRQWGGSARLTTGSLPKNDPEAQIRIAARQVRSACNTPQTEEQIAAVMANAIRLATRNAELQEGYQPRPCHAIQRAVLFRNRRGFVGPDSDLALPSVVVDDKAPDHGWTQWLPAPPLIHEVDADHFSLGLEPAIGIVGRRLAELLRAGLQPSNGHPNGAERLRVFDVVKGHVLRILPDVPAAAVTPEVRLKDLGANSLDRIEVATCAMEDLDLDLPRTRLAGVDNLQSLVEVLVAALPKGGNGS